MPVSPSRKSFTFGSRTVTLETGRIARQANAAVLVRSGDEVILVTVVAAPEGKPGQDFFPLTVEYREKFAGVGKVPGGFTRRETRITDHEILESRLLDRSVRSLFAEGYTNEVQIQATVMSSDGESDPGILAILGAGAALHLSGLPFRGPVGALRIALVRGSWVLLPSRPERELADLDFAVSVGPSGPVMVEGGARERPEEECAEAIFRVEEAVQPFLKEIEAWRHELGVQPAAFMADPPPAATRQALVAALGPRLKDALLVPGKHERHARVKALRAELTAPFSEQPAARAGEVFDLLEYEALRALIVQDRKRLDGRAADAIRPIWGETALLPRAHGSAVFTRGETQAIVTATLGTPEDQQQVDRLSGTEKVRFLLHYNFPPYSVGEIRPLRGPGRREIGHGALARRALLPVLPPFDKFPYTIRIESEISESNGSSSMATTCGGCLALMDAGVPVTRPVAGIAMGLIQDGQDVVILSDILGDEDHLGDMDFKVCGTEQGVTAVQMDNKIGGLRRETLAQALDQACAGRAWILGEMNKVLAAPRPELSPRAPRILSLRVRPELLGAVIGPRGATIKGIQEETEARISIEDDGVVSIYAQSGDAAKKALRMVRQVAGEVEVGRYYRGTVTGTKEFGAFVKIYESAEGLVHISELAEQRVARVEDVVREGQEVFVRVLGVDDHGRIKLSRKAALGVDPARLEN
jgi:polyribonucleotide nucleotidyltransferase